MKKKLIKYYLLFKNIPFLFFNEKPYILSFEATIDEITMKKKSFSRFGDGEIRMVLSQNEEIGFQKKNNKLTSRLDEALKSDLPNLLIGLPNTFKFLPKYTIDSQIFWYGFNYGYGKFFLSQINRNVKYGDSLITRFYMMYKNKTNESIMFKIAQLKKIWEQQDVLFVEGAHTKLGIGNNLFDNVKSIQRLICPSENAFEKYDEILQKTKNFGKDKLIIIALGPTATVLAYDLAKSNFWALDLGHIDIEYMWFLQKSKKKEAVKGKYVNEAGEKKNVTVENISLEYHNQILYVI